MGSKTIKLSRPSNSVIDTYFLASDWHDYYLNESCFNILLDVSKEIPKKKRKLIIPGDFLDLPDFMTKNLNKHKRENIIAGIEDFYIPKANEAFEWGNEILDIVCGHFSEVVLMEGNHDWRLWDFQQRFAPRKYKDEFDFKKGLFLDERGVKHVKYNYWLDIGKMSITHGMYHGTSALNKHQQAAGGNVVFGHIHQASSKPYVRRGDTVMAWSLPCMCDMNPPYLKDSENNWSNGFGILNMRSSGKFNFWTALVIDGELVMPNGEIYRG